MARYEPKTFKTILKRMASRLVARTALTDLTDGGVLHTLLAAIARELDDIGFQMTNLQRIWDLRTAAGEDLDERAKDVNPDRIYRFTEIAASGSVVFSRSGTSGIVTIPLGTTVNVPDGGPSFTTTGVGTIADLSSSSGSVGIVAVVPGEDGNADAGTITQMAAVTGVETVTNAAGTTGGLTEESDSELRDRIRAYLRSLPRGTPDALKYAVLSVELDDYGRVVSAEVIEDALVLGVTRIYVDDGAGTAEVTDTLTATEVVVASATGGEVRMFADNVPIADGPAFDLEINAAAVVENTDYTLNRSTGQITLDATLYPTGLAPADTVDIVDYTWYEGLIEEAQKVVNGDPGDRTNYPGYRAAGTIVYVLPPTVLYQVVQGTVVVEDGYDRDEVIASITDAIERYVNGLGVNGDMILSELIYYAQAAGGVTDITFTAPSGNIVIGEAEIARITSSDIDIL